jgi:hypothetical protein
MTTDEERAEAAIVAYWDADRFWVKQTQDWRLSNPDRSPGPITKYVAAAIRDAVAAEREKCCRDVCHRCRKGDKPELSDPDWLGHPYWVHGKNTEREMDCMAGAIRARSEEGQ